MKCSLKNLFVFVICCSLSSCYGFFWNTQQTSEQQQQQQAKALPLSYYRTYTYHPLTLQTPQMPTSYRFVPSTNNLFTPQMMAKSSPAGTFTAHTILAPTNLVPQPAIASPQQQQQPNGSPAIAPMAAAFQQQQQPQQQHQLPAHMHHQQPQQHFQPIPDMNGFPSMIQPSQPLPPPPSHAQHQHLRQNQFYPENPFSQFQYMPTPPQYNMQQVQFVPCMCPVTLSMNPELAPVAEKRVDEPMPMSMPIPANNIEPLAINSIESSKGGAENKS